MKISQNELERQRFLERQRAERDAASLAADARVARQVGFDEGFEKGFDEGFEKGQIIARIHLWQQLLKQPETSNKELGRLLKDDLLQLEDSLKRQLGGQKESNGTAPTEKT